MSALYFMKNGNVSGSLLVVLGQKIDNCSFIGKKGGSYHLVLLVGLTCSSKMYAYMIVGHLCGFLRQALGFLA